jgi:hypothetical protein
MNSVKEGKDGAREEITSGTLTQMNSSGASFADAMPVELRERRKEVRYQKR